MHLQTRHALIGLYPTLSSMTVTRRGTIGGYLLKERKDRVRYSLLKISRTLSLERSRRRMVYKLNLLPSRPASSKEKATVSFKKRSSPIRDMRRAALS